MKPTVKVTGKDYRQAKFMINNVARVFPAQSVAAKHIIAVAERVIALYNHQQKGIRAKSEFKNANNILGQHLQNVSLFFAVRSQARAM